MLVRDATLSAIEHDVADALGTPVGQIVGMMDRQRSVRAVIDDLITEYAHAVEPDRGRGGRAVSGKADRMPANHRSTPDFVAALREFLTKESPPERVRELDERHEPPLDLLRRLGELGYLSIGLPEAYGGHGDAYDIVCLMEEVGYHSLPLGHLVGRTIYAMQLLLEFGTDAQRERWIPRLRSGEIVFTVGMTEPDAGSDAAAVKTRAIADGAHYVINGEKVFSSSMGYAGLAMVSTRTKAGSAGREGLTMFLVDPRSPGIECRRLETLGDWSVGTYQVSYTDVRVHPGRHSRRTRPGLDGLEQPPRPRTRVHGRARGGRHSPASRYHR